MVDSFLIEITDVSLKVATDTQVKILNLPVCSYEKPCGRPEMSKYFVRKYFRTDKFVCPYEMFRTDKILSVVTFMSVFFIWKFNFSTHREYCKLKICFWLSICIEFYFLRRIKFLLEPELLFWHGEIFRIYKKKCSIYFYYICTSICYSKYKRMRSRNTRVSFVFH